MRLVALRGRRGAGADRHSNRRPAVTKTVGDALPDEGQAVAYTVNVKNNGTSSATNIVIRDILPAGVTFVSAVPAQGTYDPATGMWNVGTLASGDKPSLTISVTVNANTAAQTITNTASVYSVDQYDPVPANNTASIAVRVNGADLQVTKTVNDATPKMGETITFTVVVRNNGPLQATTVSVTDLLPAGLTYKSHTASTGTYVPGTGVWTVGNLNNLASATLTLAATVNSGTIGSTIVNTASASAVTKDSITANNTASASIKVESTDLSLAKSVNNATPNQGDAVAYTVTVTNNGPDAATSVVITDVLPVGVTFVSAVPAQGTYNNTTGLWTVGSLAVGASTNLVINVTVNSGTAAQLITNTARVASSGQDDPVSANNSASASFRVRGADLSLIKAVNNDHPVTGDAVIFTLTVTNNGPDAATDIAVTDLLPGRLLYVSSTATQGSYVAATGVWSVGSLASGASAALTINTTLLEGARFPNSAAITASSQPDSVTANNQSTVMLVGSETFAAGACIIDMGLTTQAAGLKPYGLVYDLVINK